MEKDLSFEICQCAKTQALLSSNCKRKHKQGSLCNLLLNWKTLSWPKQKHFLKHTEHPLTDEKLLLGLRWVPYTTKTDRERTNLPRQFFKLNFNMES